MYKYILYMIYIYYIYILYLYDILIYQFPGQYPIGGAMQVDG